MPTASAFDLDKLRRVVDPGMALPEGLPSAWYLDPDLFALERDAVFARSWFPIGFGKDVPEPGDFRPVDLLGLPLLLLRDRAGTLRVFHNVCSHRGVKLVTEPGRAKAMIRCPYHNWCYGLDGALKATPQVGGPDRDSHPAVDRSAHGLKPLRCVVLFDLVFITLSAETPDFESYAGPLLERLAPFRDARLFHGGPESAFTLEIEANWKLAVENYLESYHLPWVHPGLNSYSRLEDHYVIQAGAQATGQGSATYRPSLGAEGQSFPALPGLPAAWQGRGEYPVLFPNAILGLHPDHIFVLLIEPLAPERTRERTEIYYFDEAAARGDGFAELRAANARLWRGVFEEDVMPVERMQQGRHSPGFDGGILTPVMEGPTRAFHVWMAERLLETLEPLPRLAAE